MAVENILVSRKFIFIFGILLALFGSAWYWHINKSNLSQEVKAEAEAEQAVLTKEFESKSLVDVRRLLVEQLTSLKEMSSVMSFSSASGDMEQVEYAEAFDPPTSEFVKKIFNDYLKTLRLEQKIVGGGSYIYTGFRAGYLRRNVKDYDVFDYSEPQIHAKMVHFKDGSSMLPNNTDEQSIKVDSAKRIVAVDLAAKYTIPGEVKSIRIDDKNKGGSLGFILKSIQGGKVTLMMPPGEGSRVLYVQAFDAEGKVLRQTGSSSRLLNVSYLEKVESLLNTAVARIDSGVISSKEELISYIILNKPSRKDYPSQKISVYSFRGAPVSLTIFITPESQQHTQEFTINTENDDIDNGLIIGVGEDGEREGLVDEQGQWIIAPQYFNLTHKVGGYYSATNSDGEEHVYLLRYSDKKFVLQNFHLMRSDVIGGKYAVINKGPYDDSVKGLLDIEAHKVVLPLEYGSIELENRFFIAVKEPSVKERGVFHYDVYSLDAMSQIVTGDFNSLKVDDGFIFVNQQSRSAKKVELRFQNSRASDGSYVYDNFNIYNSKGHKLNSESYSYISDGFGKDGFLLVRGSKGEFFYLTRSLEKADFDLSMYEQVYPFSNGLAAVSDFNGKRGYIDLRGSLSIPLIYDDAMPFVGGTALVYLKGDYFLVTPKNKVLAAPSGSLRRATFIKDGQIASYNFVSENSEGLEEYKTYNQKGEVDSDL